MKEGALIGGEFWYDDNFIKNKSSELPSYFLGGGQSSLYVICEYIKKIGINKMLLPDYLCPTILDRLDKQKISYEFYNINYDFSINLDSIKDKIYAFKAVLFINYFGLSVNEVELNFFNSLKDKGIVVIEDKVHTLDNKYIGDFAFNSYRKFVPYSGSILYTKHDVCSILDKMPLNMGYFRTVRDARYKKTQYVILTTGTECEYLSAFHESEKKYYCGISKGDCFEKKMISKLDIEKIGKIRRENYLYLLRVIRQAERIQPIFNEIEDEIPLGLPIYVEAGRRDLIRHQLVERNIFLPIHWDLINENRINSNKAKEISSRILTLVVDQRYSTKDMDVIIGEIIKLIG